MKDRFSRRGAENAEKKADKVFYSEIAVFLSVCSVSLAKRAREKSVSSHRAHKNVYSRKDKNMISRRATEDAEK
jgi:hypothetical protein